MMRGLDTNLLIRYITRDEPRQARLVKKLIDRGERTGARFFVSTVVLCELAWTLRGRLYGFDRSSVATAIETLLSVPLFEVQSRQQVRRALGDYREGRGDFADYLIGREGQQAGCTDTVTFDGRLTDPTTFTVLT